MIMVDPNPSQYLKKTLAERSHFLGNFLEKDRTVVIPLGVITCAVFGLFEAFFWLVDDSPETCGKIQRDSIPIFLERIETLDFLGIGQVGLWLLWAVF